MMQAVMTDTDDIERLIGTQTTGEFYRHWHESMMSMHIMGCLDGNFGLEAETTFYFQLSQLSNGSKCSKTGLLGIFK